MQIYVIKMKFKLNDERKVRRAHFTILSYFSIVVRQLGDRVLCDDIR